VREQVSVPICVGERLYTRWDFQPALAERLANYLMPDVVWTGGISEVTRISSLAETYHVPVTPYNAMGPLQAVAGPRHADQAELLPPGAQRRRRALVHSLPRPAAGPPARGPLGHDGWQDESG
jgi:L-alanine-DL-glutamate epimerase-like enolase superfamily enzyme